MAAHLGIIALIIGITLSATVQAQLNSALLTVFAADPVEPGWPLILVAGYEGTNVPLGRLYHLSCLQLT